MKAFAALFSSILRFRSHPIEPTLRHLFRGKHFLRIEQLSPKKLYERTHYAPFNENSDNTLIYRIK